MNATVESIPNSTCGHRTVIFDVGTLHIHSSEIADAKPETFDELKHAVIIILKHQYLTRRAAGRTANQAINDLVGFVVRV